MHVVIAYESMYGNTHRIADAIGSGFGPDHDVTVAPIHTIDLTDPGVDLLIIGAPAHAHGLPRPGTRRAAVESAHTKFDEHQLEPTAAGPGVREWLQGLPERVTVRSAAFDTRFRPPAWLVGHPARRISRTLHRRGATVIAAPASFFVDKHEQLVAGELDRAHAWGEHLRRLAESGAAAVALRSQE